MRIYLNKFDAASYKLMFDFTQELVQTLTERPLSFRRLRSGGNLLAMNVDMEIAQVQGFGASILQTNDAEYSKINTEDPAEIVQYLVKLCHVHVKR